MKEIEQSIKGKRKIMYSDIINLIIREDYRGKMFNEIILWCNYKIRQGKYNVLIEHTKFQKDLQNSKRKTQRFRFIPFDEFF